MLCAKRTFTAILLGMLMSFATFTDSSWSRSQIPPEPAYVPGKLILKFKDNVTEDMRSRVIEKEGGKVIRVLASTGIYLIALPEEVDITDAVKRFSSYPEIQYAEPVERATFLEEK